MNISKKILLSGGMAVAVLGLTLVTGRAQTAAPQVPGAEYAPPPAVTATQQAVIKQQAPAPVATPAPAPTTAGTVPIATPLVQSAPGSRGALVQEHQMEQLRALLAPTPAAPSDIIQNKAVKIITDQYKQTTVQNLARMYWAVGKFKYDDNTAIDNYLLITECKMYKQYYEDDFEWRNIRKATRQFIEQNLSEMPVHFEAMIPIQLGRYDLDTGRFILEPNSIQDHLTRVAIETNWGGNPVCGREGEIPDYPRNVIVLLNRPFSLKSIPVDPRIAKLYIQQTRLDYQGLPMSRYKRMAYLRLKLRMVQYKDDYRPSQSLTFAVIYAALEGWDVFADEAETKPMYSYTFPNRFLPRNMGDNDSNTAKNPPQKASAPQ